MLEDNTKVGIAPLITVENGRKYGSDHEMINIQFRRENWKLRRNEEKYTRRYRFDDTIIDQDFKQLIKDICLREKINKEEGHHFKQLKRIYEELKEEANNRKKNRAIQECIRINTVEKKSQNL